MFDFHKAEIKGLLVDNIQYNSPLEFHIECNTKTGELNENCKVSSFYGIDKFCSINNDTYINFHFSLHRYFNKGDGNYNDFSICDFFQTLKDLNKKFALNPFLSTIHNLEFGVNVTLPFDTQLFLNSIINYKGKEYEKRAFNGKGHLLKFVFGNYYELKIYDKGCQCNLSENVLRFEIKVRKMHFLKSKGIKVTTYADLLNMDVINKLKAQLLKSFDELLIYDNTIKIRSIKLKTERERLLDGRNPKYWTQIKNPNTFKKNRSIFRKLVIKHGKSEVKKKVFAILSQKIDHITNIDSKTQHEIDEYLNGFKAVPNLTALINNKGSENVPDLTGLSDKFKNEFVPELTV